METAFGKSGADFAIKRLGEDRVVTGCKRSAMIGKANVIAGPAMGDQRVHQPAVRGFYIAVEERPDVIAADRLAPLHHGDIEIGAHAAECQRHQPRRQSATRKNEIMVDIHHRASLPGARYEVEQGTARRLHGLRWAAAKRYAYWNGTACFPVRIIAGDHGDHRSEEHTSELQSLMRISYAVFCL